MTDRRPIPPKTLARIRDVEAMHLADPSLCDDCEEPMPGHRRRDARYCSDRCRKAASRDRTEKEKP